MSSGRAFDVRSRPIVRIALSAIARGALAAVVLCSACTAASASPAARVLAAHNALDAMGAVRLGPVREGALTEGASQSIDLALEARCYTIAAFASETVRALALSVLDDSGAEIARAAQQDSNPSARVCASRAGRHRVTLRSLGGSGSYALALWSSADAVDRSGLNAHPTYERRSGSCGAPIALALGTTVQGDASSGFEGLLSRCLPIESPQGRSVVYRVDVPRATRLRATLRASFDGAVSIRTACGPLDAERSCAIDEMAHSGTNEGSARVAAAAVDPGTYFVVVDAAYGDGREYQLEVHGEPLPSRDEACRSAETLTPNQLVEASFAGHAQYFDLECSDAQAVAQRVYRFVLERRTRVRTTFLSHAYRRVAAGQTGSALPTLALHGEQTAALAYRRSCDLGARSSACQQRALGALAIGETLDAGPWFVVVEHGAMLPGGTLGMQQFREGDPAEPGDRCADALPMQASIEGDTMSMNDDVQSECSAAGGAPDQLFRLDLRERTVVSISNQSADAERLVLAWTERCDGPVPRASCAVVGGAHASRFERMLDAGTHFLAVESAAPGAFSEFALDVRQTVAAPMERACASAPLLPHGQRVRGLIGDRDEFDVTTACGAPDGPRVDRVYRLQLSRRSRVQITVRSEDGLDARGEELFVPTVSLRAACALDTSELQCSNTLGSRGREVLDPGTYFAIVSAEQPRQSPGRFSLRAQVELE